MRADALSVGMYMPPAYHHRLLFGYARRRKDHNYVAPYPGTPPQSPVLTSGPKSAAVGNHIQSTTGSCLDEIPYHPHAASGLELGEVIVTTTCPSGTSAARQPQQDLVNGDDSVTRCICDFQHDDGYMICCDQCGVWQHVDCMRVDRENIPESYLCELCQPRHVDKHRAIQIQTRKRDDLSLLPIDSSATETEDETTQDDVLQPVRKKFKNDDSVAGAGQKRRVKRMSKDDSPKKRLHVKTRSNGLTDNKARRLISLLVGSVEQKKTGQLNGCRLQNIIEEYTHYGCRSHSNIYTSFFYQSNVLLSPQKPVISRHLSMLSNEHLVGHEETFNGFGFTGSGVTPTEALFAAVECVTSYQDAACNSYTSELQTLLSNIRFSGQHTSGSLHWPPFVGCAEIAAQLARQQPCRVAPVGAGAKMGIEATDDIITHQPLTEYIGNVMLRDQYDQGNSTLSCAQPYVLFYTKLDGLDLCVDARIHGNEARFVRRSCTPNAEVRHVLDGSTVRFFLHATKSIIRGAEITIPFDFNYHKCLYVVECACTRISCPVAKYQRRELNNVSSGSRRQRITRSVDSKLPVSPMHPEIAPVEPLATPSKIVPSSPASVNSKQKRPSPLQIVESGSSLPSILFPDGESSEAEVTNTKSTPLATTSPVKSSRNTSSTPLSAPPVPMLDSEKSSNAAVHSDSDDGEKAKKKTREEKKLEAILKTIERMEKREKLKQQANARTDQSKKQPSKEKDAAVVDNDIQQSNARESTVKQDQKLTNEETQACSVESRPRSKSDHHAKSKKSRHCSAGSRRSSTSVVNCPPAATQILTTSSSTSTTSPLVSVTAPPSLDETSSSSVLSAQMSPALTGSVTPIASCLVPVTVSVPLASASSGPSTTVDRMMRPPKKLMMRDHDVRRDSSDMRHPLTVQTDCPAFEVANPGSGNELLSEFMPCVPSPHSHTLSSLRRASTSSASAGGSAKKRWLQKAMYETTTTATAWTPGATSLTATPASCHSVSTTAACALSPSVGDFVTPLKKRRLARESLSVDDSMPGVAEEDDYSTIVSRVEASSVSTSYKCAVLSSDSSRTTGRSVDDAVSDVSVDAQDDLWSRHVSQLAAGNRLSTVITGASTTMSMLLYAAESSLMGTNLVATSDMKFDEKDFSEWKHSYRAEQSALDDSAKADTPVTPCGDVMKVETDAGDAINEPCASLDGQCADFMLAEDKVQRVKVEIPEFTGKTQQLEKNCKVFEQLGLRCERAASSVSSASAGGDSSPMSSGTEDTYNQRSCLSDLIRLIATPKLEKQNIEPTDQSFYLPNHSLADVGVHAERSAACVTNGWPLFADRNESVAIGKSVPMFPMWRDTAVVTSESWSGLETLSHGQLGRGFEALKSRNLSSECYVTNVVPDQSASLVYKAPNAVLASQNDAQVTQTLVNGLQKDASNGLVDYNARLLSVSDNNCQDYKFATSESQVWYSPVSEHEVVDRHFSSIPSKKKVSLLEYRQRKSQKSGDTCNNGDQVHGITTATSIENTLFPLKSDSTADMRLSADSDAECNSTKDEVQRLAQSDCAAPHSKEASSTSDGITTPQELVTPSSRSFEHFANVVDRVSCLYETARLEAVQSFSPSHAS